MIRQSRTGIHPLLASLFFLALLIAGCSGDDADATDAVGDNPDDEVSLDPAAIERVDELVTLLDSLRRDELPGHIFEIDAWVTPPPRTSAIPSTPQQGCPVVPDKQDWLSDEPIQTQIEVAGASIPNERLAGEAAMLRLIVPYQLGFVDIPERATLRGQVLDTAYAGCPEADTFFILDEVVEALPFDRDETANDLIQEWDRVSHDNSGLLIEYPAEWDVEQRDTGESARFRFVGPEGFRSIRLEIVGGETYWHPDVNDGSGPPDILGGDRQEPAFAGAAHARLIDDTRRTSSGERELRLVFNHQGLTIFLAVVIRDGANLETDSIAVFSEMANRIHLRGDVTMSDPMDPILAASDELGEGPFLSEADARYVALQASGMNAAEAIEAQLVSEREARIAVDGACSNFDGRPSGIWLVTVEGITPGGSEAWRLVYLDAETGTRLCQAEAPGVS